MENHMKLWRLFVAVIIALAICCPFSSAVYAQESEGKSDEALILDWDKAWELALQKSDAVLSAKDQTLLARHQVSEAYSYAMPTINLNGAFQHYFEVPSSIFNLPNFEDPSAPPIRLKTQMGSDYNVQLGIDFTQPLWLAGKTGIALRIAKKYRQISEMGESVVTQELQVNLTQSFYGALLADEYVQLMQQVHAQTQRHKDQVQALFDQGMVSEYDLIRAKVAVANVKPQVVSAESNRDLAYKSLKNLLGLNVETQILIKGDLDQGGQLRQLVIPSYEHAVSKALEDRLEFQQLKLQSDLYYGQYQVETRSWLWPNFLLNLNYSTQAQATDTKFSKYEFLDGWGGSLVLQIPIFDGFASHFRAQQALVNRRSVQRQEMVLERGVRIQVSQALSDMERTIIELEAAQETLDQSKKGAEIAELRYQEGVGTQLEVLDSQLQYNQSRINFLQAKFNLLVAKASYKRALGLINN